MVDENHPDQSAISPNQEGGEHVLIIIYNQKKNLKEDFVKNFKKLIFLKKEINLSKTLIFENVQKIINFQIEKKKLNLSYLLPHRRW